MRVAIFTETFLPKMDGIVRVVCLLLDHLAERGIETVVVAPQLGDQPLSHYNQSPIISVPGVTFPPYPELKVAPPTYSTYRELRDFQPDIAHFIHPVMIGIPGMVMAKYLDVPTLASFHLNLAAMTEHHKIGFLRPLTNVATRMVFNWADYSLAPSRMVQQEMLTMGVRDVGLWRRGVDAERFHPRYEDAQMREQLSDGHPDDTLMLYVGRLSAEKQIEHLRPVLEQVPGTRLAIIGDGPSRAELEAHFAGTNTRFMGYIQGEDLSRAYASADMFVFPSALETFGLVVVEAMAAGLPVVSSRVGGVTDVVEEGVTGYTFDSGDIEALIAGVRQIATSRERIQQMGEAARAFAETQTWPAMMDEVIELYADLIEMKHGRQVLSA